MAPRHGPSEAAFLSWAGTSRIRLPTIATSPSLDDFQLIGDMIGEASVVALSEAVHGAEQPLVFRNGLFQYLVQERHFTAIALESGLVESRVLHDYVRHGRGSLQSAVADGFSWTFEALPQNQALVEWIRGYNAQLGQQQPIHIYGFDMSGSPGNSRARFGMSIALTRALEFVEEIDPAQAESLRSRVAGLLPNCEFVFWGSDDAPGYHKLTPAQRASLSAVIDELIAWVERTGSSGKSDDWDWARRVAHCARQADMWLREVPQDWRPSRDPPQFPGDQTRFFAAASDVRDQAQADNLQWIIGREGAGKVLVFASRFHVSTAPVRMSWSNAAGQKTAGIYLREHLGNRLLTIGNLIGGGHYRDDDEECSLGRASPESIDALAAQIESSPFALDLRAAPLQIRDWLLEEHLLGWGEQVMHLRLAEAFDVLLYFQTVTAA